MSSDLLSIRTDSETKREVAAFAASLGLTTSAFVTVVLKQAVRDGRVVLEKPLEPSAHLKKVMSRAVADRAAKHNVSPTFDNADKAFEWLDSADED